MAKVLVLLLVVFSFANVNAETTEIKRKMSCGATLNNKDAGNLEIPLDKTQQSKTINFSGKSNEKFFVKVAMELVDGKGGTPSLMIGMSDSDNKVQRPFAVTNMTLPIETKLSYALNAHYDLSFYTVANQILVGCEYSRTPNK